MVKPLHLDLINQLTSAIQSTKDLRETILEETHAPNWTLEMSLTDPLSERTSPTRFSRRHPETRRASPFSKGPARGYLARPIAIVPDAATE